MSDVQPLRALHYDLHSVGSLDAVAAPPYDVIDGPMREALMARSPFNVVEVDLPVAQGSDDPYLHAQTTLEAWRQQGIVTHDREPAFWPATQEYATPDGERHLRRGFLCRVRVEDYGPGRIRPHERTQPGPKEDRLRLTRATRANLSPIFSLFPDPEGAAWAALEPSTAAEPFGSATDLDGNLTRVWRCTDRDAIAAVHDALSDKELLIADGHHRYETARVYAQEVGGEGEHSYTLMFLCSMSDPGLTVFPTHRLLNGLDDDRRAALREAIERDFDVSEVEGDRLAPGPADVGAPIALGYLDGHHRRPLRLTLKDPAIADRALAGKPEPYRRLDTALLEALILKGALGMTEDDIARQAGVSYAKRTDDALDAVESGRADAAFLMRATPIEQVREVAAAGESMPPKSTFFYPKVPTGLVFNPLE
ncbi:MAG: hypothetical protein QOD53_665 [Thermoleophilaceae bacterium]|jgi:uncharacterized protein (DUF1015 family)|nr:hypothetical protein [Thermoleophilaceae bacterium]